MSILKVNRPEWFYILVGCIASVITGSALPVYGLVFGDIIGVSILLIFVFVLIRIFHFT
jgi:cobalamin synthase